MLLGYVRSQFQIVKRKNHVQKKIFFFIVGFVVNLQIRVKYFGICLDILKIWFVKKVQPVAIMPGMHCS